MWHLGTGLVVGLAVLGELHTLAQRPQPKDRGAPGPGSGRGAEAPGPLPGAGTHPLIPGLRDLTQMLLGKQECFLHIPALQEMSNHPSAHPISQVTNVCSHTSSVLARAFLWLQDAPSYIRANHTIYTHTNIQAGKMRPESIP